METQEVSSNKLQMYFALLILLRYYHILGIYFSDISITKTGQYYAFARLMSRCH